MDPKLKDLVGRTNLGDLIDSAPPDMDLNQPIRTGPLPETTPARSTVDPFQINFATADIAGKLQDTRTGKGVKVFALVFLGGPAMIVGLGLVCMALTSDSGSMVGKLVGIAFGLALAAFWPAIIFARRRGARPESATAAGSSMKTP